MSKERRCYDYDELFLLFGKSCNVVAILKPVGKRKKEMGKKNHNKAGYTAI